MICGVRVRGVLAGTLTLFALTGASLAAAETAPVISAHRAAVSGFGENSLAGFRAAAAEGVTDVEGDVYATKDGVLVFSHDSPLLASKCEGPYLGVVLRELDAAQLEEMRCNGEPVALLAAVIEALQPYPGVTLRIESKSNRQDSSGQRTADAVLLARQLAGAGMTDRSILQDFDWALTTRAVRVASPTQRVSALSTSISTTQIKAARSAGVYDFSYAAGLSTAFWNRYVAAHGLRSTVWTVNDPVRARAVRAEGIGTVITDVPDTVRDAYAATGSGCSLTRYTRATALRSWATPLAVKGRLYLRLPPAAPDGRIVETTLVKVSARTTTGTGTGSLRIGPKGTPYSTPWEKPMAVTSTWTSSVVEVAAGDSGNLRIRNTSSRGVSVKASAVGGKVYTCL